MWKVIGPWKIFQSLIGESFQSRIIIPLEEVRNSKLGMSLAERALHYFEQYKCDRTEHSLEQVAGKVSIYAYKTIKKFDFLVLPQGHAA